MISMLPNSANNKKFTVMENLYNCKQRPHTLLYACSQVYPLEMGDGGYSKERGVREA